MSLLQRFTLVMNFITIVISLVALWLTHQTSQQLEQLKQHLGSDRHHAILEPMPLPPHVSSIPRSLGAPYDDLHPLTCSRITYAGKNINSTVTYTVPEGWSVWRCLKERFPFWDDRGMMQSLHIFKFYIDEDPSLKYRDPDHIPVGYVFTSGGDGAGPGPVKGQ